MAMRDQDNSEKYGRFGNFIIMGVSLLVVAVVFVGVVADIGKKKI